MFLDEKKHGEAPTKADPLSLDTLIAWLEKQPARKTYCYLDNGECLFGQYFTAMGFENVSVGAFDFDHGPALQKTCRFPEGWDDIPCEHPRTFGAALARARELQRSPQ